jgi:ABC-2 type transport system permease protein
MRWKIVILFARQMYVQAFRAKANRLLAGMLVLLILYASWNGYSTWKQQVGTRHAYEEQVRQNWEKMPDKHPHRMAHYGYLAFRPKPSLSFFDFGMESYTGNVVFLEAHRQNSVNFSEAGLSTGLLRFGEISIAMVLQVLLPLVLFFMGFSSVAADRENGTLRILKGQGASWKEIIFGRSLGLLAIGGSFLLFALLILLVVCITRSSGGHADDGWKASWLALLYLAYLAMLSLIAVLVSAVSKSSRLALVSLIGIWLLFTIVIPRGANAFGKFLHPAPSKIEFEAGVEKELLKKGDSHDPNDPYYKALKDSLLTSYGVDSVQELPFNYSGFQMKEGERISTEVYNRHFSALLRVYEKQNKVSAWISFIDPFIGLRNISMALSGTDFGSYTRFQQQAEEYRYKLAQQMNELQIQYIGNQRSADNKISRDFWKSLPDLEYKPATIAEIRKQEGLSLAALTAWLLLMILVVIAFSEKIKLV